MLRSGPLTRGDDDDPAIRTFPALASRPSISATWRRRQPSVTFRAAALAASTPSPAASAPHAWEAAGRRRSGGRAAPRALRPGPARPGPSAGPPQGGRSKPPREPAATASRLRRGAPWAAAFARGRPAVSLSEAGAAGTVWPRPRACFCRRPRKQALRPVARSGNALRGASGRPLPASLPPGTGAAGGRRS